MAIQKACVILGAGASYDVGGEGAPKNDSLRPPLAIDLFNIREHRPYWGSIRRYSGAKFLGQRLARKSSSGAIDIERELKEYANHQNKQISCAVLYNLSIKVSNKHFSILMAES